MSDAIRALHREVQWKGWKLWLQRLGRNPLAYEDSWCVECHKGWPCPTITALDTPTPSTPEPIRPGEGGVA